MDLSDFLPLSELAQMFSLLLERGLVRLQRGEIPLKYPAGLWSDLFHFFLKTGKRDHFWEPLPICPSLTAHGHLCEQGGAARGREQSMCGIVFAGRVFMVRPRGGGRCQE